MLGLKLCYHCLQLHTFEKGNNSTLLSFNLFNAKYVSKGNPLSSTPHVYFSNVAISLVESIFPEVGNRLQEGS